MPYGWQTSAMGPHIARRYTTPHWFQIHEKRGDPLRTSSFTRLPILTSLGITGSSSARRHLSSSRDMGNLGRPELAKRPRELALFNLAIDSKVRSCDLVKLRVRDISHGDRVAARATVMQQTTHRPVQFENHRSDPRITRRLDSMRCIEVRRFSVPESASLLAASLDLPRRAHRPWPWRWLSRPKSDRLGRSAAAQWSR